MFEHFGSFLINFFFLYKGNGVMNLALQADLLVRCLIFFSYSREAAMALNSLYSDGWFALGAAALKVFYFIFSYSLVAIYFHSKSNLINNWNSCHAG
jgi:hypothetical protein